MTTYTREEIGPALERFISERFGDTMGKYKRACVDFNCSAATLSQSVHGSRPPPHRILKAMGLERKMVYAPKEKP